MWWGADALFENFLGVRKKVSLKVVAKDGATVI